MIQGYHSENYFIEIMHGSVKIYCTQESVEKHMFWKSRDINYVPYVGPSISDTGFY